MPLAQARAEAQTQWVEAQAKQAEARAHLNLKLQMAEFEVKKKHLVLSNPGSMITSLLQRSQRERPKSTVAEYSPACTDTLQMSSCNRTTYSIAQNMAVIRPPSTSNLPVDALGHSTHEAHVSSLQTMPQPSSSRHNINALASTNAALSPIHSLTLNATDHNLVLQQSSEQPLVREHI